MSEDEFVRLRLELSKASHVSMVSNDDETPVMEEELPPGTEDLADPAKVETDFQFCRNGTLDTVIAQRVQQGVTSSQ